MNLATVKRLEREIKYLDDLMTPMKLKRGALYAALLQAKSPFNVGDIIEWGSLPRKRGKVLAIEHWICDDPCWRVQWIKTDGTLGTRETRIIDACDNPRLIERPTQ